MRLHFFYDAMLGNEEIRLKLLTRYQEERTENADAQYLSWLILLLSDGLFIHKTLRNDALDVDAFIGQTAEYARLLKQHTPLPQKQSDGQ